MNKKLPKVFQNQINKNINNNEKYYYSANNKKNKNEINEPKNIRKIINSIFLSPNYIYKANVIIKTKNAEYETKIIGRNKEYLITMDNKTIKIDDIIDIKKTVNR